MTTKLLLTADEAGEALGVGRTKVYELLRVGHIQSVRIGRSRRIPHEALVAYVEHLREHTSGYEVTYRAP